MRLYLVSTVLVLLLAQHGWTSERNPLRLESHDIDEFTPFISTDFVRICQIQLKITIYGTGQGSAFIWGSYELN